jgi:hypothetical protein
MQHDDRPASQAVLQAAPGRDLAYVDETGHARLRQSIVAFIDILGFSQSIRTTAEKDDSQLLVDRILAAMNDSRQYVRQSFPETFTSSLNRWALKFFSDNLVLGFPFEGSGLSPGSAAWFVIRCAQRYQLRMALNGFFMRGALTQGPICLTDDIIFGSALLDCYELESKASIVPRVILAEPLRQLVAKSVREPTDQIPDNARNSICRDIDGWWFVSYLEAATAGEGVDWDLVERHKHAVLQSLAGVTRHDVLPKYGWACRYHNMFCHWHRGAAGYSDRYRIERVDESSTICRLGDVCDESAECD